MCTLTVIMFNVKYEKSLPNVHPDEYLDRPDTGGPIVFELEEDWVYYIPPV